MKDKPAVKQSLGHILENNIWMLKFVFKYAPSLVLDKLVRIPIMLFSTYISINVTRWILNSVENKIELKSIILLILSIFSFIIITNFIFALASIIWVPQKEINLGSKIREDMISKISKIDQIKFQDSGFFNLYTLGLNEIDFRATQVLNTVSTMITSFLSFLLISGVTANISNGFAVFGLIAAINDFVLGVKKKKYNYKRDLECTPDGRRRGYINRVTYQPEFTSDLKIYPNFLQLLIHRYRRATSDVKAIFLKYSGKILVVDQLQQIPTVIFRHILPWAYITVLLTKGQITIPEATVLSASALTLPGNLGEFMNSVSLFYWHSFYIENLRKIFKHEEIIEREIGDNINPSTPINIRVEDVSFAYAKDGKNAVNNLSMEIRNGEKIAIVGYNGAGKSTIMKLLDRIYDTDNGHIYINDKSITEFKVESLRSRIALLSQDFKIYSFTVAENILMRPVLSAEDLELVYTALKKVGLYDKIMGWCNGVNTFITREFDETGEYLSGGEAQKLALARIYAGDYDCIILDESTSALDPVSEDEIIRTIFEIFKDKTIVMISHRLVTVKYVDRIYFLSDGRVSESGTHQELMSLDGEYCAFYSAQAEKYQI